MDQIKIGRFIAECRKNKKLTQSELADKLGVSEKSISNWENGRNMPDLALFNPICEELGITINELMSGAKLPAADYQKKLEENLVSTIDYSTKKNNKKNNILFSLISIIVLMIFSLIALFTIDVYRMRNNKPVLFSTWGFDYVPSVNLNDEKIERTIRDYLILNNKNDSKKFNNEKTFVSIKTYLIHEVDNDTTIAYIWALEQTYYEDNGKIIEDSGSSMPYKITLEKDADNYIVLEHKIPGDGSNYAKDMKTLFPKSVRNSMDNVYKDGTIERLELDIYEQRDNYYN